MTNHGCTLHSLCGETLTHLVKLFGIINKKKVYFYATFFFLFATVNTLTSFSAPPRSGLEGDEYEFFVSQTTVFSLSCYLNED